MSGQGNIYAQMEEGTPLPPSASGSGANIYAQMERGANEPNNPVSQGATGSSLAANLGAGAEEGLTGEGGYAVKMLGLLTDPIGSIYRAFNPTTGGKPTIDPYAPGPVTHGLNESLGKANPELVPANNFPERLARGVGAGISTGATAGPVSSIEALMSRTALGAISGAGAAAGGELAPDKYKPAAELVGGLLAGGASAVGAHALPVAAEVAADATAPLRAAVSTPVAEAQAGKVLATRATDPAAAAASVAPGAVEVVPGSKPTTFQQTGDMGLGALEREMATKHPDLFRQRQATQNAARTAALGDIQQGGDPAAVSGFLNNQFRAFEDNYDAEIANRAQQAQTRLQALGGQATPEAQGAVVRATLQDAEDASRAQERGMWTAVDPDGTMTGNVSATKQAAERVAASLQKTAKPMAGEEADIFEAAKQMPDVAPVSDLIALRSRVSTEMRNELIAKGRSPTYARLSILRGDIQDNLSNSISDRVQQEASNVESGRLAPEDTVAARLKQWQDDFYRQRESTPSGDTGPAGNRPLISEPAAPGNGVDGASAPLPEGQGGPGGDQGLSADAGPTFDEAAAGRLREATAATRERAGTFGRGGVADVLRKAGTQDIYRLPEASVPGKFFHPGLNSFGDIQGLIRAIGEQRAIPLMADYAASSLRRAAMREDGTLDPARFTRWRSAHEGALRALPEAVRNDFNSAHQAAQALSHVQEARAAALRDAQSGAIGRVMNAATAEDVTKTVGSILKGPNSLAAFRSVSDAARRDPAALAGLRQAVADHITQKLISNTEAATSGVDTIKADGFQTFVKENRPQLAQIFSPAEMRNLEAIAADIKQAKRSEQAVKLSGQSNTAQDTYALARGNIMRRIFRAGMDTTGGLVGFHFGGPEGAGLGFMGAEALSALREAGINKIDDLVTQAMLHPEIARELLKKAPQKAGPGYGKALATTLRKLALSNTLLTAARMQQNGRSDNR